MLGKLFLHAVNMSLEAIIQAAPRELRQGLSWFAANAGKTVKWSEAGQADTRLFSTPKGIYKPEGSKFALSVRQTLKTAYPDRAPQFRPDGTWTYLYHQEGETPEADGLFTNKGLRACMEEGVPVGVARQVSAKPDTRYAILGLARVTHWKDGVFQLDGYAPDGTLFSQSVDGPLATVLLATEPRVEPFDPASQEDARQRILSSVVRRRGQSKFRAGLLRSYGGKCAITSCSVEAILEAAHVTPYLGPETNALSNGILLRADIHTLWDLGLIAIDPKSRALWISPSLTGSEYDQYAGMVPFVPAKESEQIAVLALQQHWELATKLPK